MGTHKRSRRALAEPSPARHRGRGTVVRRRPGPCSAVRAALREGGEMGLSPRAAKIRPAAAAARGAAARGP